MSIKVKMFIKLPYIIKLNEGKDYKFSFTFDEFEMFDLIMINNEDNEDNEDYPLNSCSNIVIEAIYKECDYLDYKKRRISSVDKSINEYIIELPEREINNIFNVVNIRIQEILNYLRNKSNMFWIESFPVKPICYSFGNEIEFNFYSPNAKLSNNIKQTIKYTDYYITSNSLNEINSVKDDIFTNFNDNKNNVEMFSLYLNKAEKSLYERDFEDFIIYCSISVESFIRRYIGLLEPNGDIIFNRISASNYDYLDQYYNVLLKYLKGKSLKELDGSAFTHLKRMYNLRNSIMHNGIINDVVLKKVGLSHLSCINFEECKKILYNAKKSFLLIGKL